MARAVLHGAKNARLNRARFSWLNTFAKLSVSTFRDELRALVSDAVEADEYVEGAEFVLARNPFIGKQITPDSPVSGPLPNVPDRRQRNLAALHFPTQRRDAASIAASNRPLVRTNGKMAATGCGSSVRVVE